MEQPKDFPKIIAHQGYGSQYSQNMLSALETATAAQVDMIEIDLHETGDGRFIVHHDNSIHLDSPAWRHLTYSRLQQFQNHHEQAPLLSDCLSIIGATPVDIEIKSYVNADRLFKALSTSFLARGSVISSGDYHVLRQLHIRGIEAPLLLIITISNRRSIRQNTMNALLCVSPHRLPPFLGGVAIHHYLAHKRLIRSLQRNGKKVFVWTIDEKKTMKKFISWGVDGIITNFPDKLYELLNQSDHVR